MRRDDARDVIVHIAKVRIHFLGNQIGVQARQLQRDIFDRCNRIAQLVQLRFQLVKMLERLSMKLAFENIGFETLELLLEMRRHGLIIIDDEIE